MKNILVAGNIYGDAEGATEKLKKAFSVRVFDKGLSALSGVVGILNPDMIVLNIRNVSESDLPHLMEIHSSNPDLPIVAMGERREYVDFCKLYLMGDIEHLDISIGEPAADVLSRKLKMPMKEVQEGLGIGAAEAGGSSQPAASSGKKRIFLIDDNAATLRSMKGLLDGTYEVSVANSGEKGLAAMRKNPPDLLLLDYEMPEMDGRMVFQEMRTDPMLFSIPVVFLTGINDRESIAAVLALRPSGYLLKPVQIEKLHATIEKALTEDMLA